MVPKHLKHLFCVCFYVSIILWYGATFASEELEVRVEIVTI